jgi:hypothetical protein
MEFDYDSPAELFIPKRGGRGRRQPINYRRFATAAEAIRFAVEEFLGHSVRGCGLEIIATIAMRFADYTKVLDIHCAERRVDWTTISRSHWALSQSACTSSEPLIWRFLSGGTS